MTYEDYETARNQICVLHNSGLISLDRRNWLLHAASEILKNDIPVYGESIVDSIYQIAQRVDEATAHNINPGDLIIKVNGMLTKRKGFEAPVFSAGLDTAIYNAPYGQGAPYYIPNYRTVYCPGFDANKPYNRSEIGDVSYFSQGEGKWMDDGHGGMTWVTTAPVETQIDSVKICKADWDHQWKDYTGFNEVYEFCVKCDHKRNKATKKQIF